MGQRVSERVLVLVQALKEENIKVLTVNPAQTSTHMTWDRPDSEYIPDKMIQVCACTSVPSPEVSLEVFTSM